MYVAPAFTCLGEGWDQLASNEVIFAAVAMKAEALGTCPLTLRKGYRKVTPEEHPVARLFAYGMTPWLTSYEWVRLMETLRSTTGAGYALKELDQNGQPVALWPMHTHRVEPVLERESRDLYYQVTDGDGVVYLHNSCVFAVTQPSEDGYHPVSPIQLLRGTLTYDREVKEFSLSQMKNTLRASLVVKLAGTLDQKLLEQYDEMMRRFQRNGVLYLDRGKDLQELQNQSAIDPKVFEVEKITVARVARVFGVPADKLAAEAGGFSSSEQSDLSFLRYPILPAVRMYEQQLSRILLADWERDEGYEAKLSLNGFARADMNTRGDFYFKGIRSGWFSPNDIRELEDLPPYPQGNVYYVSRDLVPVDQAGQGKEEG